MVNQDVVQQSIMDTKLKESLDSVLKWMQASGDFVKDQAPLVVNEIISYYTIYYLVCTLFFCVLINVLYICLYRHSSSWNKTTFSDEIADRSVFRAIFLVIYIGSLVIILFTCVQPLIKVYFAPRLFIIEYISSLIK